MCPPALAVPLMIASTAVSATGAVLGGIGAKQQADYAAQVADQNAKIAANQAQDSIANTNLEAQQRARQLAQTKGRQLAALAANGVSLDFGSAIDLQRDTAMIGAEDLGQIYKAGNARTQGYDAGMVNYRGEAAADRAKGQGALLQGLFSGFGTALSGASQVSKYKGGH